MMCKYINNLLPYVTNYYLSCIVNMCSLDPNLGGKGE